MFSKLVNVVIVSLLSSSVWGASGLYQAVQAGDALAVRQLLESGTVDPNAYVKDNRFIHEATKQGHVEIVKLLLRHGANIDAINLRRRSSMHLAAKKGDEDMIELLMSNGAKVWKRDIWGYTPFGLAKKHGEKNAALLIKSMCKFLNSSHVSFEGHGVSFYVEGDKGQLKADVTEKGGSMRLDVIIGDSFNFSAFSGSYIFLALGEGDSKKKVYLGLPRKDVRLYIENGDNDGAIKKCHELLRIFGESSLNRNRAEIYTVMSGLYRIKNNKVRAELIANQASSAWEKMAKIFLDHGNRAEAKRCLFYAKKISVAIKKEEEMQKEEEEKRAIFQTRSGLRHRKCGTYVETSGNRFVPNVHTCGKAAEGVRNYHMQDTYR